MINITPTSRDVPPMDNSDVNGDVIPVVNQFTRTIASISRAGIMNTRLIAPKNLSG
jgi:hypothetical protein